MLRATDHGKPFRPAFDYKELDAARNLWVSITDEGRLRQIARDNSPISHVTPDDPPTLIIHGDKDELVPLQQSQIFIEKLRATGVVTKLIVKEGAGHGWSTIAKDVESLLDWFDVQLKKTKDDRPATENKTENKPAENKPQDETARRAQQHARALQMETGRIVSDPGDQRVVDPKNRRTPGVRIVGFSQTKKLASTIKVNGANLETSLSVQVKDTDPKRWTYVPRLTIVDLVEKKVVHNVAYHDQEESFERSETRTINFDVETQLPPGLYEATVSLLVYPMTFKGDTEDLEPTKNFVKQSASEKVLVK
jgi:hypothetical protein